MFSEVCANVHLLHNVSVTPRTDLFFFFVIKRLQTRLRTSGKSRQGIKHHRPRKGELNDEIHLSASPRCFTLKFTFYPRHKHRPAWHSALTAPVLVKPEPPWNHPPKLGFR